MRLVDADYLLQIAVPHGWSTPKWVSEIGIEAAPTIDATPVVHGKWTLERRKLDSLVSLRWFCSNCGDWQSIGTYPYCPYCGAKMDEGDMNG